MSLSKKKGYSSEYIGTDNMIGNIIKKIFGSKNERELKRIQPIVEAINAREPYFKSLTDDQLREKTGEFKERLKNGATLDEFYQRHLPQ